MYCVISLTSLIKAFQQYLSMGHSWGCQLLKILWRVLPLYLPCIEAAVVGETFLYLAGRYWAAFITNWRAFR